VLRHEAGHSVIDPVFASISHRTEKPDCFIAIDIDDCDCEFCVEDRGPITMYATISLGLVAGKQRISQRLTAKEAKRIANTLLSYAQVIEDVSEVEPVDLA
jgi:hypothetical protein